MSLANVGAALKGIGDTARNYDLQQEEMAARKFMQEQRMRERQKWSDEDKEKAMVSAIRPEGEYDEPVTNDPYQEGYTTGKKIKRTVADVQGDMERGYRRLGLADKADQARLRASQFAKTDREEQQAKKFENIVAQYKPIEDAIAARDPSKLPEVYRSMLDAYNYRVPDGYTAIRQSVPGGHAIHYFNERTGKIEGKPEVIPEEKVWDFLADKVAALREAEMAGINPTLFSEAAKRGIDRRKVGAEERQAGVAERRTAVDEGNAPFQRDMWTSSANMNNAHAGYYNARAGAEAKKEAEDARARAAMAPLIEEFGNLTPEQQQGKDGERVIRRMALLSAKTSGDASRLAGLYTKRPVELTESQKVLLPIAAKAVEAFHEANGKKPAGELRQGERAIWMRYGFDPDRMGATDPLLAALQNYKPEPEKKKAEAPKGIKTRPSPAAEQLKADLQGYLDRQRVSDSIDKYEQERAGNSVLPRGLSFR